MIARIPIPHDDVDALAVRAVGGDVDAFAELYGRFRPLVESAASRVRDRHDREDLEGELRVVFCEAVQQYASRQRAGHLPGLVKVAVDSRVAQWFRFRNAKRRAGAFDVADGRNAPLRVAATRTPLKELIDQESLELAFHRLTELAPRSRRLIGYLREGFLPAEACALIGLSKTETKKALTEIRRVTGKPYRRAVQCVVEGKILAEHPSIAAASRASGVPVTSIHYALQKLGRIAGGYQWRYARNENGDTQ